MEIILLKRDVLFILVQVSVFWNFCNGYIQLCQDSNIGSPNGTTVTAEIGKPASLLFCVTSNRTVHAAVRFDHPSHRGSWIRLKEKKEETVSKFNITNKINITLDNIQSNDLNVSFSVKVYTEIHTGSPDYKDFLILTFILHKQNSVQLCQNKTLGSDNGTTVTAGIGKSTIVTFCVTSSTTIHNEVFIDKPRHRSGWYPKRKQNGLDVKIVLKINYAIISIVIEAIKDRDLDKIFLVKACTEGHARGNYTNNEFILFTFSLKNEEFANSREMTKEVTTLTQFLYSPSISVTTTTMATTSSITATTKPTEGTLTATSESTTSRAMTTPTLVTDPTSQCQPQATSRYPKEWLLVGSKYMVLLPDAFQPHSSKAKCPNHVGDGFPDRTDTSLLGPCLTYLLLNSTIKTIRIQNNEYLNVANNAVKSEAVPYRYRVVCIVPQEEVVPIKLTEFTLEILTSRGTKLHRDLLPEEDSLNVTIYSTEDTLNLTCVGNGKPEPEVQILHDNVILTKQQGRANHVISQAGCKKSDVYFCHALNSFMSVHVQRTIEIRNRMKIQSFTITYKKLGIGGDVEMRCSVAKCSSPYVLTLTDDTNQTIARPTDRALIHKITNVQCSDMGTYFCRGETPDGYIEEKRSDLRVYGCPIQVCRGDDESKVIPAVVGQKLNISVCVMSDHVPWRYRGQNKDVSVNFTRSQPSGIYFTAHVIFHNVTEHHHGNHIIMMENGYGSLNYTITIILQTTTTQIKTTTTTTTEISTSHQPSTTTTANKAVPATNPEVHVIQGKSVTEAETQPLVIILLLVLLVIVLFIVVGVILYKMRGTLFSRLRERNTGDTSTNNDTGQAEYANLRELDSVSAPAPDRRDEGEQETNVTNYGGQELLLPDISNKDSGRVISEQGLVYVTVAQAANLSKKKKKPAQSKPKRTRKEPVEPVEYTTLDFEKTGKIVIAEEEDEKKDDGGNQEKGSVDQQEETGEKQEKFDDKKE